LLQQHLPNFRLVKAFNNILYTHLPTLSRSSGAVDRSAPPIAGDDESAKRIVADLLDRLGWDAVDIGRLEESWRTQLDTPVFVEAYMPDRPQGLSEEAAKRWFFENKGVPAGADQIRMLANGAVRDGSKIAQ
jgi:predicted dinucleotide-binding enzyme